MFIRDSKFRWNNPSKRWRPYLKKHSDRCATICDDRSCMEVSIIKNPSKSHLLNRINSSLIKADSSLLFSSSTSKSRPSILVFIVSLLLFCEFIYVCPNNSRNKTLPHEKINECIFLSRRQRAAALAGYYYSLCRCYKKIFWLSFSISI